MAVTTSDVITCATCGRSFRPKPELAGKAAKCPCGAVIRIPAARAEGEGDEYDLVPTPAPVAAPAPAQAQPQPVKTGLAPDAAQELLAKLGRSPSELAAARRKCMEPDPAAASLAPDGYAPSVLRDRVVPAAMIAVGLALWFVEARYASQHPAGTVALAVSVVMTKAVLAVGLMLAVMGLACVAAEVCFVGPRELVVLKLIAIAVGPGAVYGLLTYYIGDTAGAAAGTFASLGIYAVLFLFLMKLDLKDTGICVLLTWILITAANYVAHKVDGLARDSWV